MPERYDMNGTETIDANEEEQFKDASKLYDDEISYMQEYIRFGRIGKFLGVIKGLISFAAEVIGVTIRNLLFRSGERYSFGDMFTNAMNTSNAKKDNKSLKERQKQMKETHDKQSKNAPEKNMPTDAFQHREMDTLPELNKEDIEKGINLILNSEEIKAYLESCHIHFENVPNSDYLELVYSMDTINGPQQINTKCYISKEAFVMGDANALVTALMASSQEYQEKPQIAATSALEILGTIRFLANQRELMSDPGEYLSFVTIPTANGISDYVMRAEECITGNDLIHAFTYSIDNSTEKAHIKEIPDTITWKESDIAKQSNDLSKEAGRMAAMPFDIGNPGNELTFSCKNEMISIIKDGEEIGIFDISERTEEVATAITQALDDEKTNIMVCGDVPVDNRAIAYTITALYCKDMPSGYEKNGAFIDGLTGQEATSGSPHLHIARNDEMIYIEKIIPEQNVSTQIAGFYSLREMTNADVENMIEQVNSALPEIMQCSVDDPNYDRDELTLDKYTHPDMFSPKPENELNVNEESYYKNLSDQELENLASEVKNMMSNSPIYPNIPDQELESLASEVKDIMNKSSISEEETDYHNYPGNNAGPMPKEVIDEMAQEYAEFEEYNEERY